MKNENILFLNNELINNENLTIREELKNKQKNILIINKANIDKIIDINWQFDLLEESRLNIDLINLNSSSLIFNLNVNLIDVLSTVKINIIDVSLNGNKSSYNFTVNNIGEKTNSKINFKAIGANNSEINAHITGAIKKTASESTNFQSSKGLLLDEVSKIEIDPILLIDTNQVQAGHSASISKITDDEVYYLMSRGVSKTKAKKMIIKAFIISQVEEISIVEYKEQINEALLKELGLNEF